MRRASTTTMPTRGVDDVVGAETLARDALARSSAGPTTSARASDEGHAREVTASAGTKRRAPSARATGTTRGTLEPFKHRVRADPEVRRRRQTRATRGTGDGGEFRGFGVFGGRTRTRRDSNARAFSHTEKND